jgi:ankyrin repeat protein
MEVLNLDNLLPNNNDNQDDDDDDDESNVLPEQDPDFDDLPELIPDLGDDDSDDEFDDLPELEVIPELVLATYGAIRERVDIEVLRSILDQAPADETRGRPLLRLIKFAMRCNRERSLQEGILELLIQRDTECPKIPDERGGFLLHTACECASPIEVIKYVLKLYPDAVRVPSEDGQLPIHYACARRTACTEVVALLLKEFPDAVRCASRNKMLPLHVALNKGAAVDIVFQLLDIYPESAGIKAQNDEVALHIACRTNMSLEIIKRLVELYPEGIHAKDSEGGLALHRACCGFNSTLGAVHPLYEPILLVHLLIACDCEECGAPLDVAQFLMERDPDGASTIDKSGKIPLHYAARNGALELTTKLLERFPGGIHVKDHDGKLPIHLACNNGSNEALVRLLIDKYPESLKEKDKSQSIPLHYAAARRMAKTDTLKLLVERYPEGVHSPDMDGRLPLHHAVETHCMERIRVFVDVDPYTTTKKTRDGKSPLQLACLAHRHLEIKQYLLHEQTTCVQQIREAFNYVTDEQCGFPDLVQANMWSYTNPGLYQPSNEDLEEEEDDLESDEESDEETDSDEDDDLHGLEDRQEDSDSDEEDDDSFFDDDDDSTMHSLELIGGMGRLNRREDVAPPLEVRADIDSDEETSIGGNVD